MLKLPLETNAERVDRSNANPFCCATAASLSIVLKVSSALGPGSELKLGVSGITLSVLISSPTSGRAPNCGRDTSSRRPDSEKPGDCEGEGTECRGAGEAGSG